MFRLVNSLALSISIRLVFVQSLWRTRTFMEEAKPDSEKLSLPGLMSSIRMASPR